MTQKTVAIAGGGLAGLTLALQLRRQVPSAQVVVIEKTSRELKNGAHKVGESSVELGSHYFGQVLGLDAYLRKEHLIKNGLRFFVGSDTRRPLHERVEIGPPELPKVPSYQMDRGRLERDLRQMCVDAGVILHEGAGVQKIELDEAGGPHRVSYRDTSGHVQTLSCDWVVDATGRRRIIQSQKKLTRGTDYKASAAWFRVEGHLDIKSLVPDDQHGWHQTDPGHIRYLSTCHLMGAGYWVWLIPLSPGSANADKLYTSGSVPGYTSIGIVTDERYHALNAYGTRKKSLTWLKAYEPALYQALLEHTQSDDPGTKMLDFLKIEDYSYTTSRFLSEKRWACVGEAAMFPDPFYSPGSDFIALENAYTGMAIERDFNSENIAPYVERFNTMLLAICDYTVSIYRDAAHIQTKPHVFAAKLYWDNFGYWSFLCPYYFQEVYREDEAMHERFEAIGKKFGALVPRGQKLLSAWARLADERPYDKYLPFPKVPSILANLHLALVDKHDKEALLELLHEQYALYEELYVELAMRALKDLGPKRAESFLAAAEIEALDVDEKRLKADDSGRRGPRIARDVTRVIGAPLTDLDTPVTMRQMLEIANKNGAAPTESPQAERA